MDYVSVVYFKIIMNFEKKFFSFNLSSKVQNSKYTIATKNGLIIKLKNKHDEVGYGEISPLIKKDFIKCEKEINYLLKQNQDEIIQKNLKNLHPCVQSGINCALAEMRGELKFRNSYPFDNIYQTAILVNSSNVIKRLKLMKKNLKNKNITIKWKVGIENNIKEEKLLENILSELPKNYRLRIDANGSWSRQLANHWADILKNNHNLDWLEQPLAADDFEGLNKLNKKIPIALDESLIEFPELIESWEGWQIRRPSQESNPIKLVEELIKNQRFISISSSFETGIARRLLFHCAFIQLKSRTPKVPGLALENTPESFLFSKNPNIVWENL